MTLDDVLVELRAGRVSAQEALETIRELPRRPPRHRVSEGQSGLWALQKARPRASAYNVPLCVRLRRCMDRRALEGACRFVLEQHPVLASVIEEDNGIPCLRTDPTRAFVFEADDISALEPAQVLPYLRARAKEPFVLSDGPLMRVYLLSRRPDEQILLIVVHHIVCDGRSGALLLTTLFDAYAHLVDGQQPAISPASAVYADFVAWEEQFLSGAEGARHREYWMTRLGGALPVLVLPTDHPRSPGQEGGAGQTSTRVLPPDLSERINAFAVGHGVTAAAVWLGVYNVLLHRYTGETDIIIGMPTVGRPQQRFEPLVGYFANTVALRSDVRGEQPFSTFLTDVQRTLVEALDHSAYPFQRLVRDLNAPRSDVHSPIFQVAFVFSSLQLMNRSAFRERHGRALSIEPVDGVQQEADYGLVVAVIEEAERFVVNVTYDQTVYEPETIARLAGHLETLLEGVVADPERRLSELPMLSPAERQQLLAIWSETAIDRSPGRPVHERFRDHAVRTPHAIAAVYEDQQISYAELDRLTNQLAHHLRSAGVGPEVVVGLCVERSLDIVVGILGILKAGGAYLPLDPSYPGERLAYMMSSAGAPVLLTQQPLVGRLPAHGARVICLDSDWPLVAARPTTAPDVAVAPEHAAYVIFTSGSTGTPNGVVITHACVARLFTVTEASFDFGPHDVWSLFHSAAFDFSVWELWGALLYGGRVVVVPYLVTRTPELFYELVARESVTILSQTPSAFGQFMRIDERAPRPLALRRVVFGGEALNVATLRQWVERHGDRAPQLINMYGITETTVHVTYRRIRTEDLDRPTVSPIGRPLGDLQTYVLDQQMELVPVGVAGELYVGGPGLGRGYLGRAGLTASRFIANPFAAGSRLYRTGDVARYLANGELDFMGRADHQVKIRGFRIEPGEIEVALLGCNTVKEAVVVAREDASGQKRLVAFVAGTAGDEPAARRLREQLKQRLPDHMVPAAFVLIDALPLTANGKIDRRALDRMEAAPERASRGDRALRSDIERRILQIWRSALHVDIDRDDGFFDVGGDSFLAVTVAEQIKQELCAAFDVTKMFKYGSARLMSEYIEEALAAGASPAAAAGMAQATAVVHAPPEIRNAHQTPRAEYYDRAAAIVGISCRFPGAGDHREFWSNLRSGKESIEILSTDELRTLGVPGATARDPRYVPARSTIAGRDLFDARFFRMSPRDADRMDPQLRLLLLHAWTAVEDAGYAVKELADASVFVSASNSFGRAHAASQISTHEGFDRYLSWASSQSGTIPTVISYRLGLKGRSMFVHSNCSSSLIALDAAYRSLMSGESRYALVGAATLLPSSASGYFHHEGMNLSSDGHVRTFDAAADGMVGGEGVAVIVVKRALDAIEDGDHIYALVRGVAVNNDGADKTGYHAPSVRGQAEVIQKALTSAAIDPHTVGYIEAHGTGTRLGDPIEFAALCEVYGRRNGKKQFCGIGSVKTNVGHLDTAAGLAGCIKVALSLSEGEIPPTLNYVRPNPEIDVENSPFYVVDALRTWSGPMPRRAGVSAFGIGGTNAHALMEHYAPPPAAAEPPIGDGAGMAQPHVVPLSARDDERLRVYAAKVLDFLTTARRPDAPPRAAETPIADLAFTLQVGREAMPSRVVFIVGSTDELCRRLGEYVAGQNTVDGWWSGVAGQSGGTDGLLDDEDRRALLEQWIASGQLIKVATLWARGAEIDWRMLHRHDRRRRLSLPTYPFAEERYDVPEAKGASGTGDGVHGTGASSRLHPLVHQNTSDVFEQRFTSRFSGDEFFVSTAGIGPVTALAPLTPLEMARAAVAAAFGLPIACLANREGSRWHLRNLEWLQPVTVASGGVHVGIDPDEAGGCAFEIYARRAEPDGALADAAGDPPRRDIRDVMLRGRAVLVDTTEPARLDIDLLKAGLASDSTDPNATIGAAASSRAVERLTAGVDLEGRRFVLARLELPASLEETRGQFGLHPTLLDGAWLTSLSLLTTIGGIDAAAAACTRPSTLERLEIFGPCPSGGWALAREAAGSTAANRIVDVDLCDDDGVVWVRLNALTSEAADRGAGADAALQSADAPASAVGEDVLRASIQGALVRRASVLLKVKADEIDLDANLSDCGFDSITLTDLAKTLNEAYHLELTPALFFEHPTVRDVASHLVDAHRERLLGVVVAPPSTLPPDRSTRDVAREHPAAPRHPRVSRVGAASNAGSIAEPIAIVGVSGCFPRAEDVDALWMNLRDGRDCIGEIPTQRWDWRAIYGDPMRERNKTHAKWGGFIDGIAEFDPLFFGISPHEAELMDPQQRLLMTYVWKVFEDAGYSAQRLAGSDTGIFVGTASSGYERLFGRAGLPIEGYSFIGVVPSVGPNRMSYLLDLHGPSEPIETACSSSLVAIHRAVMAIASDQCEMAVAGGVNTIVSPELHISASKAGMLSRDGRCKAFSAHADGIVRGEGVGMLLLKKLSVARRDGDHIYALVRGSGVNHGGKATSLTAPNPKAQAALIASAYTGAGIDPATVGYIEAHGTGTVLGDPVEINALKSAFRDLYAAAGHAPAVEPHCGLGSVKSNIGHLEMAAGVAGVIKVLLQLRHQTLVKSLHCEEQNPYIQLEGSPFYLLQETRPWLPILDGHGRDLPRRAGISSFGIGGVNAHVIVEEYRETDRRGAPGLAGRPAIIVLSARSELRLRDRARQLLCALDVQDRRDADLQDIAYTLQIGRDAMDARLGLAVTSIDELKAGLGRYVNDDADRQGLHVGVIARTSEARSAFDGDEDLQAAIGAWMDKGKYTRLLDAWVAGIAIDWRRLYGEAMPRRVSLPTYPFAKDQYWVTVPDSAIVPLERRGPDAIACAPLSVAGGLRAAGAAASAPEAFELMTFEEAWLETALDRSDRAQVGTVVCFVSRSEDRQAVSDAIAALDPRTQVIGISQGTACRRHSRHHYTVVRDDGSGYLAALNGIRDEYGEVDAVLYLWPLEDGACLRDPRPIVHVVQALARSGLRCRRLLLAGDCATGVDRCHVESWIGFERSLGLVLPQTRVAVVFEERDADDRVATSAALSVWLHRLWQELGAHKGESALYRGGRRYVCRVRPTAVESGDARLRPGGTYLITGGAGGLGRLFAGHLAERYTANLVLVGRSPLDDARKRAVERLEQLGGRVLYIAADVCDRAAMEAALRQADDCFGGVHGVIHAGGVGGGGSIVKKDVADFQRVLDPKIAGTLVLDELLRERPLDFVCYFSSSSSVLGDFGSCDYAIANRFEMAFARGRSRSEWGRPGGKALAISWPHWNAGGMAPTEEEHEGGRLYLKSSGQRPLEPHEGIEIFERLLADSCSAHLVMAGQPSRVHRFLGIGGESDPASARTPAPALAATDGRRPHLKGLTCEQCIAWDLKAQASELLKIARDELNADDNLADFGFDSIGLAEFATRLGQHYGIEMTPAIFFSYPTLTRLTGYFAAEHGALMAAFYREEAPEHAAPGEEPGRQADQAPSAPSRARRTPAGGDTGRLEPIAIVGMSGRFPQARNVDELWRILEEGRDVVQEIPAERFDWRQHFGDPETDPGKTNCKWSGCVPGVDEFDPAFFDISPREAETMDPRQRLILQEAWKALEDAGWGPAHLQDQKIGMFVGVEPGDYPLLVGKSGGLTGNNDAILAARLAYALNLRGPAMAINTSCSSALVAAHQACVSLRAGDCDAVIVGGVNLMLTPYGYIAMGQAGMLSPDGRCYAFDRRANGMVPGEAVVAVILKRLSRAEADGDPIHAVIRGSALNYDGRTNGITAPSGAAQTSLLKEVYDGCGVTARDIEYVVTHGTGTRLGDPVEINALYDAFKAYTTDAGFCALTSTKSNFGHTFAASGLVSLVSLVQSMRHYTIPPSLHCETENDYITWRASPFYVNKTAKPWPSVAGRPLLGAVSAFGMSGTNAHVVVESYERTKAEAPDTPHPCVLLALSAKTAIALEERIRDLSAVLSSEEWDGPALLRMSHTLLAGRQHFAHRCAIVIDDRDAALHAWQSVDSRDRPRHVFRGVVARGFLEQPAMDRYAHDLLAGCPAQRTTAATYQETLHALADLFCQGYNLHWDRLFDGLSLPRIGLPTYPFAKDRYWFSESRRRTPEPPAAPPAPPPSAVVLARSSEPLSTSLGRKPAGIVLDALVDGSRVADCEPPVPSSLPFVDVVVAPVVDDRSRGASKTAGVSLEMLRDALITSLAEALYVTDGDVDPDRAFVEMGLDSIVGVEWLRSLNRQYGTSFSASVLYDYPSIQQFASFLYPKLEARDGSVPPPTAAAPAGPVRSVLEQVFQGTLSIADAKALLHDPAGILQA